MIFYKGDIVKIINVNSPFYTREFTLDDILKMEFYVKNDSGESGLVKLEISDRQNGPIMNDLFYWYQLKLIRRSKINKK